MEVQMGLRMLEYLGIFLELGEVECVARLS